MNLTSLCKLAAENGSFSCVQKRSDIAYPKQYSHRKTEPESFGSNQTHAKILDVIEAGTAFDPLEGNQLIHSPTADEMTLAGFGNSHRNGVLTNLTLAPNFDFLEITGSPDHLMVDIEWNTISGFKETLFLVKQHFLA